MVDPPNDDMAPLLPALKDLWLQGKIPTRIYRAFFYARGRGQCKLLTLGELRDALDEPRTPRLVDIPFLGRASIAYLRTLFGTTSKRQ